MRRREFLCMLGAAAACPLAARAQISTDHTAQIAYLGALSPATLDPRQIEQFKAGLLENGLIEGRNALVDYLWAEGSPERVLREPAVVDAYLGTGEDSLPPDPLPTLPSSGEGSEQDEVGG